MRILVLIIHCSILFYLSSCVTDKVEDYKQLPDSILIKIRDGFDTRIAEYFEKQKDIPLTACVFGQTETAIALIKAGADVNQTNNDGSTALHTAAFFCREEIVKALLKAGADRATKNNAGSTAAESVIVPFEAVKPIYDYFSKVYEPLGLKLDYQKIQETRPVIADMLK